MMFTTRRRLFIIFVILVLSACNGGGGLSATVSATDPAVSTNVTDPSIENARLADIQLSVGSLDQTFQASQLAYTVSLSFLTTRFRLTIVGENESGVSITIAGQVITSGSDSDWINLIEGDTVIEIIVTAEDGITTLTYTLTVSRLGLQASAAKLTAGADSNADDSFGYSVSLSGDSLAVGAYFDDDDGSQSGSVYVFTRSAGIWTLQQKITAADGAAGDRFGVIVSLSGDDLAVGAYWDDGNGFSSSGSVYVFTRSAGVWTEQQKINATDSDIGDQFGFSVSLSGDNLAVGAFGDDITGFDEGSAYVFTRSAGVWTEQQKVIAADGDDLDGFGNSVSLSGDSLAVGSSFDSDVFDSAGSVYVFTRSAGVWTQQQKITAADGADDDYFGWSVSLSGDSLAAGSEGDDDNGSDSGAAYVFVRSAGVWTQQAKVTAADGVANDFFGLSVSLSGENLAVGAFGDVDSGSATGSAAYLFTRSAGAWTQGAKLIATDSASANELGISVSLSGDNLLVGAHYDDDNGADSGAVYIY